VVNLVTRLRVKQNLKALQQVVWTYCHVLVKVRNKLSGMKCSWRGVGGAEKNVRT
jgi:hypothetical protein